MKTKVPFALAKCFPGVSEETYDSGFLFIGIGRQKTRDRPVWAVVAFDFQKKENIFLTRLQLENWIIAAELIYNQRGRDNSDKMVQSTFHLENLGFYQRVLHYLKDVDSGDYKKRIEKRCGVKLSNPRAYHEPDMSDMYSKEFLVRIKPKLELVGLPSSDCTI